MKEKKNSRNCGMTIWRINIIDQKTGICLFEKLWQWTGKPATSGICSLVLTFVKISKDIGDNGFVSQVFFESSTTKDKMGTGRERSFSTGARYKKGEESLRKKAAVGSVSNAVKEAEKQDAIQMTLQKIGDELIMAAFHSATDDVKLVKKFVNGVLGDFKDEYSDQLKQLRPSLDLLVDESKSEKTVTEQDILEEFKSFGKTVQSHAKNFDEVSEEIKKERRGSVSDSSDSYLGKQ